MTYPDPQVRVLALGPFPVLRSRVRVLSSSSAWKDIKGPATRQPLQGRHHREQQDHTGLVSAATPPERWPSATVAPGPPVRPWTSDYPLPPALNG